MSCRFEVSGGEDIRFGWDSGVIDRFGGVVCRGRHGFCFNCLFVVEEEEHEELRKRRGKKKTGKSD